MSEHDTPKRRGRPLGKRGTFSFRVTPSLRSQLVAAASESERSVSEEIELRLENSFRDQDVIAATVAAVLRAQAEAATVTGPVHISGEKIAISVRRHMLDARGPTDGVGRFSFER